MRYKVSKKIIKATKKCHKGFECLSGKFSNCYCALDYLVMHGGIYLDENEKLDSNCPYFFNFGNSCVCNCPTRIEIFRKYHV